jgi:hypothetical protein
MGENSQGLYSGTIPAYFWGPELFYMCIKRKKRSRNIFWSIHSLSWSVLASLSVCLAFCCRVHSMHTQITVISKGFMFRFDDRSLSFPMHMYFSCTGVRVKFHNTNHNPLYWMVIWLDNSQRYFWGFSLTLRELFNLAVLMPFGGGCV